MSERERLSVTLSDNENPQPKVIYDGIQKSKFAVEVDAEACGRFLQEYGLSPSEIEKHTLIIKYSTLIFDGDYKVEDKEVGLFLELLEYSYDRLLKKVVAIVHGKRKPRDNDFKNILYTKRLSRYLVSTPEERAIPFAHKLIMNGVERRLNNVLHHELRHVLDISGRSKWEKRKIRARRSIIVLPIAVSSMAIPAGVYYLLGGRVPPENIDLLILYPHLIISTTFSLIPSFFLLDKVDPDERRANRFMKELKNVPKWRSLVKLSLRD